MHLIVFDSTHSAISAEKIFKDKKIPIEIIPTPREITASCGLSIRFEERDINKVTEELNSFSISIKGVYELIRIGAEKKVNQIL